MARGLDPTRRHVSKIGVLEGLESRQAPAGIQPHELFTQVDTSVAQAWNKAADLQRRPNGEGLVPVLQTGDAGPHLFIGSAQYSENLEQLVDLAVAGEQGSLGDHLSEDRSHSPHVNGQRVSLAAEENFGGAVPQRHHFVSKGADGGHEGASQAKVGNLQTSISRDENVLRLEVAVHHTTDVAVLEAAQELVSIRLDELPGQRALASLKVLLEILVYKLKDEVKTALALHNVVESEWSVMILKRRAQVGERGGERG